jgi:hypothetical protein
MATLSRTCKTGLQTLRLPPITNPPRSPYRCKHTGTSNNDSPRTPPPLGTSNTTQSHPHIVPPLSPTASKHGKTRREREAKKGERREAKKEQQRDAFIEEFNARKRDLRKKWEVQLPPVGAKSLLPEAVPKEKKESKLAEGLGWVPIPLFFFD